MEKSLDQALDDTIDACKSFIDARFPDAAERGAAAVLLGDGTIVTGTSPDFINPSTTLCHEVEPYCAAFRLDRPITASVCLHRTVGGEFMILSPCGVCRERLAGHGPDVLVGVPTIDAVSKVRWVTLRAALPHYWVEVFPDEVPAWVAPPSA